MITVAGEPRRRSPRSATPPSPSLQRWCSARVGEGLIYDLRRALFAKVQRMPIAFFTRSPTGALISRLNNDVIGAQTAVTSTLGSVVSNVVVLVTTLAAMLALEWRLTLMALVVLPMFVIPARRVGRHAAGHLPPADAAQRHDEHADDASASTSPGRCWSSCSATTTARTRRSSVHAAGVRDTGIRSAMYGRVFFVALGVVGAVGAAAIYGVGAHLVVSGQMTSGTLVALAALTTRVLPAAHRADQRPRRPDDVARQLRAGLRGARRQRADQGAARRHRPRRPRRSGHVRRRALPLPAGGRDLDRLARAARPGHRPRPGRPLRADASTSCRARRVALVGVSGAGKSTLVSLVPRLYDVTSGAVRIDGHDVRDLTLDSLRAADRRRRPGPPPVPRHDRRQPALRQARRHHRRAGRRPAARRASSTP